MTKEIELVRILISIPQDGEWSYEVRPWAGSNSFLAELGYTFHLGQSITFTETQGGRRISFNLAAYTPPKSPPVYYRSMAGGDFLLFDIKFPICQISLTTAADGATVSVKMEGMGAPFLFHF